MGLRRKRPRLTEATEAGLAALAGRWRRARMAYQRATTTLGIVGIGTAVGAILGHFDVGHWVTGLIVALACVAFAAVLWTVKL
ncbi:MAG: hypothetical protein OXG37_14705 [Actinomycetia bacterium]|nr:hypothetical protein [Actinomycetes bacterium]